MKRTSIVQKQQTPLRDAYVTDPKSAWVTDIAVVDVRGTLMLDKRVSVTQK